MSERTLRKPTTRLTKVVAWTVGLTALACILFALITGIIAAAERKKLDEAEAWCEQAQKTLATDSRFAQLTINAPCRMYAYAPPRWFISVTATILDDAAEKDLKEAVMALSPPKEPHFHAWNCYGDVDFFRKWTTEATP